MFTMLLLIAASLAACAVIGLGVMLLPALVSRVARRRRSVDGVAADVVFIASASRGTGRRPGAAAVDEPTVVDAPAPEADETPADAGPVDDAAQSDETPADEPAERPAARPDAAVSEAAVTDSPIPALLSLDDTVERLGLPRKEVLRRLKAGSLVGQRVGTVWVALEADVARVEAEAADRPEASGDA